jgi:hypothetical protein
LAPSSSSPGSEPPHAAGLLDVAHETLLQRFDDARKQTKRAVGRALTAVQAITIVSIAIAACAVGKGGS